MQIYSFIGRIKVVELKQKFFSFAKYYKYYIFNILIILEYRVRSSHLGIFDFSN